MAENSNRPLLDKDYHENCPGCMIDQLKECHRGIAYRNLSYIWMVSLCTALPISSLFSFIYFMIRDFHIAERPEDIGFCAGFVGSPFMVGRALTSVFWGVVADRYCRKPVILIGTFSVVVLNILFGLSTSFWMVFVTRFLLGCFNSLLGTIRAYASEICRDDHRVRALSVVRDCLRTAGQIPRQGLIIGPAIGGFFAQETLHRHHSLDSSKHDSDDIEVTSGLSDGIGGSTRVEEPNKPDLLKNCPVMSTIIVYCVFSRQEIAYSEVSVVTGIFILLNNAVPQYQRGAANAISMTAMSISKVFDPAGGGVLLIASILVRCPTGQVYRKVRRDDI